MFEFFMENHKYNHIHFIGIGGISMSGLAEILLIEKYKVTGTDTKDSAIINRLRKLGAEIYIGHKKENVVGADLIIYTDAISKDNEELQAAISSCSELIDRASFLGALMKNYTNSIAVSGTHGKTTTTSMLATITNHAKINPTILIGGELDDIGGNVKLGNNNDYILTEACEYKANILKYFPTMAIILNIDEDHLDYFRDMEHIVDTFIGYGKNLKDTSYLVINIDDANSNKVIENTVAKIITFGIDNDCDYKAEDIIFTPNGNSTFNLIIKNKEKHKITLNVMGIHNVYNALAAVAASHTYGISMETISEFITYYKGVHRRLELKGFIDHVKIIDDYAHHPTEIRASLNAVRNSTEGRIFCIFQPHTYTRTKMLLDSFAEAFKDADRIIIADIYAARELDKGEIHSRDLAQRIKDKGSDGIYLGSFKEIESFILNETRDDDVVLTMGAGNVHLIGESLLEHTSSEKKAV